MNSCNYLDRKINLINGRQDYSEKPYLCDLTNDSCVACYQEPLHEKLKHLEGANWFYNKNIAISCPGYSLPEEIAKQIKNFRDSQKD